LERSGDGGGDSDGGGAGNGGVVVFWGCDLQ
jgi:hypothetical protein